MARVAIIGRKFISPEKGKLQTEEKEKTPSISGSAVSLSRKPSNNQDLDSVWRRPQASQVGTYSTGHVVTSASGFLYKPLNKIFLF